MGAGGTTTSWGLCFQTPASLSRGGCRLLKQQGAVVGRAKAEKMPRAAALHRALPPEPLPLFRPSRTALTTTTTTTTTTMEESPWRP